jgi:hypothetical protein
MYNTLLALYHICLFKKGPQDIGYSTSTLKLLAIINLAISLLTLYMLTDLFKALLQALLSLALLAFFSWMSLYLHHKIARFNQTTSALIGTDAIIGFIGIPMTATVLTGQGGLLVFLLMIGLMIWHWAIIGHIMRNALEQNIVFSYGLALLYLILVYKMIDLLFPVGMQG